MLEYIVAIPARLHSTRLPNKLLLEIKGKPLLQWTIERAIALTGSRDIWVIADDLKLLEIAKRCGVRGLHSGPHLSGTARIAAAISQLPSCRRIINWQGDEPLLPTNAIMPLITTNDIVATIGVIDALADEPNQVKIVTNHAGYALYFSRALIPHGATTGLRHLGCYSYCYHWLSQYSAIEPSSLATQESLEQLAWLQSGTRIKVYNIAEGSIGIDTEADWQRFCVAITKATATQIN